MEQKHSINMRGRLLFVFLITLVALTGTALAAEVRYEAPRGTADFTFTVPVVVVEEEAGYAGAQFGMTLSSQTGLQFNGFTMGEAISTATEYPEYEKNGTHTFGFYTMSATNTFKGRLVIGYLSFTYRGTEPQMATIDSADIFRVVGKTSRRDSELPPAGVLHISRGTKDTVVNDQELIIGDEGVPLSGFPFFNPFEDVFETDWFYEDVLYVYGNGLMFGTSDEPRLFSPYMSVSRAMVVTVLYRYTGSPDVSGIANPFPDTEEGTWYTDAVKWGAENDIILGYGNGNFGPNDDITREQLALILRRYEQFTGKIPPNVAQSRVFADDAKINDWSADAVDAMVLQGIINGKPDNLFDPQGIASRAELAAVLHRYLEAVEPDSTMPVVTDPAATQ